MGRHIMKIENVKTIQGNNIYYKPKIISGNDVNVLWQFIESIKLEQNINVYEIEDIVIYAKVNTSESEGVTGRQWFVALNNGNDWTTIELDEDTLTKLDGKFINLLK